MIRDLINTFPREELEELDLSSLGEKERERTQQQFFFFRKAVCR